jgi:hypothetical protein
MLSSDNRRTHPRQALARPCKVFHAPTGRYAVGQLADVSRSGALVDIRWTRTLHPGDEIEIYIAWSDRAVLTARDGVRGSVRRAMSLEDGRQMVGVEFADVMAERLAAAA